MRGAASRVPMNSLGVAELTPREVQARKEKGDPFLLLDIREHDEVAMAALAGAVHIPMGDLGARLGELPKDKDIVVFCHHGNRSLMVGYQLKRRGFTRIFHMPGGINLWSQQVDPSVPQYE